MIDQYFVTSPNQLVPNSRYIFVHCINRNISSMSGIYIEKHMHKLLFSGNAWFGSVKYDDFDHITTFSFQDTNIIPNKYNNHALFEENEDVRGWLNTVSHVDYLALLARHDRGHVNWDRPWETEEAKQLTKALNRLWDLSRKEKSNRIIVDL